MILVKAPHYIIEHKGHKVLFLAGSIEMGSAELWQDKVCELLKDEKFLILNPRRDDWDSSWVQSKDNPQFRQQVEWELDGLAISDCIIFYFDKNTKSPITLLELGLCAWSRGRNCIVVCPDGFWRKGNVDIVCERYNVLQMESLEKAIRYLLENF